MPSNIGGDALGILAYIGFPDLSADGRRVPSIIYLRQWDEKRIYCIYTSILVDNNLAERLPSMEEATLSHSHSGDTLGALYRHSSASVLPFGVYWSLIDAASERPFQPREGGRSRADG